MKCLKMQMPCDSTCRCRAFNTLIIRYEQNEGTEFEPLLETVVLIFQIFGECSLYS